MVQLQSDLETFEAAGIQLIGISYDDVSILKAFSEQAGLGFPLLSDPGSATIKSYGVLNEETDGLPHPGTIVVDRSGVVRAKLFKPGYQVRHKNEELLETVASLSSSEPETEEPKD